MNDAAMIKSRRHSISGAFVFTLLGIFAVFATFVVLLGAQFYRNVVEQTDINNERRILTNYIINTVRGNDAADSVLVKEIDGIDVLAFVWTAGDDSYETLVYYHDGYIREYFGSFDTEFDLAYGEIICKANALEVEIDGSLLNVSIIGTDGEVYEMHLALRCSQEVAE